jgi:serine/threonine-protein kinase HipA
MDRSGKWRLSPAYDVTYSYDVTNKWLSAHQMTVNGKKSNINLIDLLEVGEKMGLKKKKCMDIISKISRVVSDFERYANEANIREKTFADIKEILNQNKVEV